MSTRQTGNRHENSVMEQAEALGYATFAARGSRGPVDVLAFDEHRRYREYGDLDALTPLCIQVGTTNKPIASTLAELEQAPRPIGSLCLVARRHRHKDFKSRAARGLESVFWSFHTNAGKFTTLAEAIDARA